MVPAGLLQAVIEHGVVAPAASWVALTGGRTNKVWRITAATGELICKLYIQPGENPLYPNQPGAEYEALKALFQHDIAPEPVALLNTDAGEVLIYRHLNGFEWRSGAAGVAKLLARLHAVQPDWPLRNLPSGSAAMIAQTTEILGQTHECPPALARSIPDPGVDPVPRPCVIHTDVVANNIVVTERGPRLIDWQCPAIGDPCEDLASFLSPAMQFLYTGRLLPAGEAASFLAAYPDREIVARFVKLAPLFHWRIAAYCNWKAAQGDKDYAHAMSLELSAL